MLNHKGTVEINTERLLLRKFVVEDADDVFAYISDERVLKYIPVVVKKDRNIAVEYCTEKQEKYKNLEYYHWAIMNKELNKVIGNIKSVTFNEDKEFVEIGYTLAHEFWGNGYVTEALQAVIDFFMFEVGFNRVEGTHQLENVASGKVMQKCGMKFEGILRGRALTNLCEHVDCAMYAVLKEDRR